MSSTNDKQTTLAMDASCRWPLLVLFTGGAGWLVLSTLSGLFGTLKFHNPDLFASCPAFSYGRLAAAQNALLLYGFGVPTALGVAMWLMARLGRTPLAAAPAAITAGVAWHTGVLVMWVALMFGGLTGYEWFEVPKAAAGLLLGSYVFLALPVVLTLAARKDRELHPPQWFLLAAVFWFAWIFATAGCLIHWHPASGIVQAAIHYWYGHNLVWVFFGFIGLAVIFHLLPEISGRALFSRDLAVFAFWALLALATFGGVPHGVPLPAWMPSVSAVAALLTLVPVIAVAVNCHMTMEGRITGMRANPALACVIVGSGLFVFGAFATAASSVKVSNDMLGLTLFAPGLQKLLLHGFVALTLFGAVLHLMPRVAGADWPLSGAVKAQFWAVALGVLFTALPLMAGGLILGWRLMFPEKAAENMDVYGYEAILERSLTYIRMATLGDVLLLVGHAAFLVNLKLLCYRQCRACCASVAGETEASGRAAEVTA